MDQPTPALGPDPRLASVFAYLAWWASGAVMWVVERDRPAIGQQLPGDLAEARRLLSES